MSSTATRDRDERGRYQVFQAGVKESSIVAGIINEELEKMFQNIILRLNDPDISSLDTRQQDEVTAAKQDLKAAIAARFGNPVATSCISVKRGPSRWNGYVKANFRKVKERLGENGKFSHVLALILAEWKHIMPVLSEQWKALPAEEKACFPVTGSSDIVQDMEDVLSVGISFEDSKKKAAMLWKQMRQQVCFKRRES